MSYRKLSLLLVIALVFLLVVSLGLISTWFYYYFYGKKEPGKIIAQTVSTDTDTLLAKATRRDSLEKMYLATIGNMPEDSALYIQDTLKASLDARLHEFYQLKTEIGELLQRKGSDEDLDSARVKIAYLQQRIDELRNRTLAIESENRKLTEIVKQLNTRINSPSSNTTRNTRQASSSRDNFSPTVLPEKKPAASSLSTSELRLFAWAVNNGKDQETTDAAKTEKITGSLAVRGGSPEQGAELMIVVQQPDGKVLKNSDWETGSFATSEGRKIYSARIPFDYNKGETKRLNFSINASDLPKGEYIVRVYHNGTLVGKTSKFLF